MGILPVLAGLMALIGAGSAAAGEADIVDAKATRTGEGVWRFDVTVSHADEGWEHYADRFDIIAPDGIVLGERILLHPHVTEQPFTRSLTGVQIPEGVTFVEIRANDKVHGLGGKTLKLDLPHD
ncbi:hypothetical protein GR183_06685 [Stappia sp. GBMRC 2046]|uniref:Uncharacterized protein n=2 Tax=Stappia sediminis TaxID=2692190 RepID=A0A7X3LT33_9HYPH|nr:hypothetical protein [Stappia sediminis]